MQLEIPTTRASLLGGLKDGQAELAWEEFLRAYKPLISSWVRRAGVRESDGEDLLAEIYAHLLPRLRRFTYCPTKKFRGWLKQTVASAIAAFREKKSRQLGIATDHQVMEMVLASDDLADFEEGFSESFAAMLQRGHEIAETVRAKVNAKNWDAFYMSYVEGRETADVAQALGIQAGAIHVARCRIKGMLVREAKRMEANNSERQPGSKPR